MRHVVSLWLVLVGACALERSEEQPQLGADEAALNLKPGWFAANEGIDGADVRAIALHPSGVLYAAALGGSVYRSSDGGIRFQPADTGLPAGFARDVAVDPRDANVVYVALGQTGLYKSRDGGRSYALTGLRRDLYGVEVAPSDSNVVYALTPHLARSDDSGATFSPSLSSPPVSALAVSEDDAHTLYIMDLEGRVYRSGDGGNTFLALNNGLPPSLGYGSSTLALDPSHAGVIYAGVSGAGLYRSEDDGASWTVIADELRGGQSFDRIAVDPLDSNLIYLAASVYPRGGMFRSRNRGQSFEDASYRYIAQDIALDPNRSGHVLLAVADEGVAISRDGLASHTVSSRGMHDVSVAHVVLDGRLSNVAYAATRRGLYVTWALGAAWQRASIAPSQYTAVKTDSERAGVAYVGSTAGPDGAPPAKLYRTTNAGITWQDVTSALPYAGTTIEPRAVHGASVFVSAHGPDVDGPLLFRSQNGGLSFQRVTLPGVLVKLVTRDARDALLVTYDELWHTRDAGDSWRSIGPPGMYVGDAAVVRGQPNVIYAASGLASGPTAQLGLRKSDDGGLTWRAPSAQFANRAIGRIAVSPVDGRVWVSSTEAGPSTSIYVSTNGGVDFVAANPGLESELVSNITPHPRLRCVAFAATSDHGVFATLDAGGTCR